MSPSPVRSPIPRSQSGVRSGLKLRAPVRSPEFPLRTPESGPEAGCTPAQFHNSFSIPQVGIYDFLQPLHHFPQLNNHFTTFYNDIPIFTTFYHSTDITTFYHLPMVRSLIFTTRVVNALLLQLFTTFVPPLSRFRVSQ